GDVKLFWNAVTTDETPVSNMSYNVRCRIEDSDNWFYSPQSLDNGSRSLVSLGNVQLNKSFNIKNPASGKYYWQVQAVDQGYQGSNWSAVDSFLIKQTQAYFDFDTVCLGTATNFTDRSVVYDGAASWRWNFGDATVSALQSPTHVYAVSGTYQVKLRVTSITGIKDSLVRIVLVKAKPSPSFTAPNVCIGAPTVLTNTTNLHGLSVSEWDWNFGDGQVSAVQNPGTHNYALSGTYSARLKISTTNGCSDSVAGNVIVARYPENSISVAGDFVTTDSKLTICAGTNLLLTAKNEPLYTYQWQKDSNEITGAEANTFTVSNSSGIYNAKIINTLANCLTISEQKNINVKPVPAKPVVISDNYKTGDCVGEKPVKLKVDQAVVSYQYSWLRNGIPINNSASPVLEDYLDQGDYNVSADLNGCSVKSDIFSIAFQGAPEKPLIYAQGPVKWYLACDNLKANRYMWFFNDKPIDGAVKYYYVANQNYGVYRVSVGDSKGCYTRSDTIRIPTGKFSARNGSSATVDPLKEMKVFPNPSTGLFRIEMNNEAYGEITVSVIGQGGNEVRRTKFIKATNDFSEQVDISGQTPGSYLVNIRLGDNVVTNRIILR
ncbi:MAG TPA: PKD domain-containing protein, partial [Bacteroidales bacterium]|nr:PKD domain-containing protein [Bacteroidales bacterium]